MNFLLQLLAFLSLSGYTRSRDKRFKTNVACSQCGTEQPRGTRFCKHCGSRELLPLDDFRNLKHERRTAEIDTLKRSQHRNTAIKRIQELAGCNYCVACNTYHVESFRVPTSTLYCPDCGKNIDKQRMPDNSVFQIVHTEFPDIVCTESDYRVLKSSTPARGVLRKQFSVSAADFIDEVNRPQKRINSTDMTIYAIIIIVLGAIAVLLIAVVIAICQGAWHELFK